MANDGKTHSALVKTPLDNSCLDTCLVDGPTLPAE